MRNLFIGIAGLSVLLLSACGGGREDLATTACTIEITKKLNEQNFRIDEQQLRTSAKMEDDSIMHMSGVVVFDPGLPREYKQTVDCRVRFVSGQDKPDVIAINFTW